ncbi:MAG: hydroxymethylbilane synthase [Planctomycetes bacterium]|nr:hydroxymethylbilane synthase [Planctomycetota bacterium]
MPQPVSLRIGTRASQLALWQSHWVADQLRARGVEVEVVHIATQGDVTSGPLGEIGGQGVFTKEIQRALAEKRVDLAVHSLKDLPTERVAGLKLGAVPPRAAAGDALISNVAANLESLPQGAMVGTGSNRRRAQLLHFRPDLRMAEIRGNLDTRLRKLDEGQYDALVLAEAGLRRLGWDERITEIVPKSVMLPAVGQGALGLEIREDDEAAQQAISALDDPPTHAAVLAERALLAALRGGCLAPVGAWAREDDAGRLVLDAVVLSPDGRRRLAASGEAPIDEAGNLGRRVAAELLDQGAADLIAASRA